MLSEDLKNQIRDEALKNVGKEICGLIISSHNNTFINICKNISSYPENHFELNPFDYLKATKLGNIIGYWHSQENAGASPLDEQNSKSHNLKSIIYSWKEDKFFEIGENKLDKYINVDFEIGKNDCFSLVREYYRGELKIIINEYNRGYNWYKEKPTMIEDNFKNEGFIEIDINKIKKHDILLFNLLNNDNVQHLGIYVGYDNFLHNPRNSKSVIEFLSNSWKKKIKKIIRHKNLV